MSQTIHWYSINSEIMKEWKHLQLIIKYVNFISTIFFSTVSDDNQVDTLTHSQSVYPIAEPTINLVQRWKESWISWPSSKNEMRLCCCGRVFHLDKSTSYINSFPLSSYISHDIELTALFKFHVAYMYMNVCCFVSFPII